MIDVVGDAELLADQLGDPGTGPQFSRETIRRGALEQVLVEARALSRIELGRSPRGGLGGESVGSVLFEAGAPATQRAAIDTDALGDLNRFRRIAFEIAELVDGEAIKVFKSTKLDVPAEWTERGFLDSLGKLLQRKNDKFTQLKDSPYDGGYVVVVFSDEPDLSAPAVERYLRGQSFTGTRLITRAFFLISYDPRLDRCPYFELGVGA